MWQLVFKILLTDRVFLPVPTRIKYNYGAWQPRFAEVEAADPRFELVEGLPCMRTFQVGARILLWSSTNFGSKVVWSNTQHKSHLTEFTPYDIV